MDTELLGKRFNAIGAKVKFDGFSKREDRNWSIPLLIDVRTDRKGEFFRIAVRDKDGPDALILDTKPEERHLLLMVKGETKDEAPMKFLCGHDERHWYVAAIPERAGASNVQAAKEALKPDRVLISQSFAKVKTKNRRKRRNAAYIRQGEWFFIPDYSMDPNPLLVLQNEPISRGRGSSPHIVDSVYRAGGELVYVSRQYPNGLTEPEYKRLLESNPYAKYYKWNNATRDAHVWAKGKVRHRDHRTVDLPGWHEVLMNTENLARAGINVAFLD